ncbi:MAG TPA: NYN domain-containing protein [Thermoguttaceae bacterium]|nr:NYN domain-containing protein [Thermoguttaceae bacterium]
MSILIDGYNLLNACAILGRGVGPGSLQRARLAMLNFLAESLPADEIPRTTVVFDARDAPPGLPRVVSHRGLTVRFAPRDGDADALIEELIRTDSSPRRLTVVSSDHRLQRAARHRKAKSVDSDVWYAEIVRRRQQRRELAGDVAERPYVPLLEEDVSYWFRQFGGASLLVQLTEMEQSIEEEFAEKPAPSDPVSEEAPPIEETAPDKPTAEEAAAFENPFPPGYGEDLLRADPSE